MVGAKIPGRASPKRPARRRPYGIFGFVFTRIALLRFSLGARLCLGTATAGAQPAGPASIARYRNLVMKGGGICGIAHGGALLELERVGVTGALS